MERPNTNEENGRETGKQVRCYLEFLYIGPCHLGTPAGRVSNYALVLDPPSYIMSPHLVELCAYTICLVSTIGHTITFHLSFQFLSAHGLKNAHDRHTPVYAVPPVNGLSMPFLS